MKQQSAAKAITKLFEAFPSANIYFVHHIGICLRKCWFIVKGNF